jgi:hypothetical protein
VITPLTILYQKINSNKFDGKKGDDWKSGDTLGIFLDLADEQDRKQGKEEHFYAFHNGKCIGHSIVARPEAVSDKEEAGKFYVYAFLSGQEKLTLLPNTNREEFEDVQEAIFNFNLAAANASTEE